ncbi:hypothetical protein [Streptomyces varsoviensis]|uniref:hypothetical protein n=1 Tax=Streptomyces varsoviensis TaxID=67373 RepID=UPI000B22ACEC|nr:hypothetical protein [Streptomyces varsoviensis]
MILATGGIPQFDGMLGNGRTATDDSEELFLHTSVFAGARAAFAEEHGRDDV